MPASAPVASELFDALIHLMPLIGAPHARTRQIADVRVVFGGADGDDYFVQSADYQFDNYGGDEAIRVLCGYTNRFHIDGTLKYRPNGTRYGRIEISTYTIRAGNKRRPAFSKAQERLLRLHGFVLTAGHSAEWVV
jgi:hypothetical protein